VPARKFSIRRVVVRRGRNLGNLRLVVSGLSANEEAGSGAMNDWLILLEWFAIGPAFICLSVLVPAVFG
jgi:hypothetical protein